MKPQELRKQIENELFCSQTAGQCDGYVQTNLVVLPKQYADDFELFAQKNSQAIPVLEVVRDGFRSKILSDGANLLKALPSYDIFEHGVKTKSVKNIEPYYTKDMVFFLIGCSFSFEKALMDEGISLRHIEQGKNVSMYDTNITLKPYADFKGHMVVSMRPIKKDKVASACVITSHYPRTHGMPVHIGYPHMIGIEDINKPNYGDAVEIKEDEIPVFWACGVTPQNVLRELKLPFAITHSPGHMFVSDKQDKEFYEN